MLSPEILKKIQEIKFRTYRVMNGSLAGGHITKQKGSGFEFDQIRSYSYGDDIRFIDWNSTARTGKFLVRQYLDEKNRTIMICLDVSSSTFFASTGKMTSDVMQQVAAILTVVAEREQDNVGLILFSDCIEQVIPPSRGHKHMMYLMEVIFSYQKKNRATDFNVLCHYLVESFTKQAAVVMISDFIAENFEQSLRQLVCRREVIAIRCLDKNIHSMPSCGFIWGQDPETKRNILLHAAGKQLLDIQRSLQTRIVRQNDLLRQCNVDYLDIQSDDNFLRTLILFFKRRMVVP